MVALKSSKKFGRLITFKKLNAKPKGTFVNAFFKGTLVGTGRTKTLALANVKKRLLDRLS